MRKRKSQSSPFSLFAFQDIITAVTGIMILITLLMTLELLERKPIVDKALSKKVLDELLAEIDRVEKEIDKAKEISSEVMKNMDSDSMTDSKFFENQIDGQIAAQKGLYDSNNRIDQVDREYEEGLKDLRGQASPDSVDGKKHASVTIELDSTTEQLENIVKSNRIIFAPGEGLGENSFVIEVTGKRVRAGKMKAAEPPQEFNGSDDFFDWLDQQPLANSFFLVVIKPDGINRHYDLKYGLKNRNLKFGYDLAASDETVLDPQLGASY